MSRGQSLYDAKGAKLGTVSNVQVDSKGQQFAVVDTGSRSVLIGTDKLQSRAEGGFTTSLSQDDIQKAPDAK
jgi:hypothetical protein